MLFQSSGTSKIVFILSILVSAFWFLVYVVDVYHFAITGAVFELLWLPMIVIIFVLPVLSLVLLAKEKFNIRSLYLYSLIIIAIVVLYMISRN